MKKWKELHQILIQRWGRSLIFPLSDIFQMLKGKLGVILTSIFSLFVSRKIELQLFHLLKASIVNP